MTVTRLSGEIERILAEDPGLGPAAILQALNRYAHLVLSHHAIFATAVAVELAPADGTRRAATAGHPPPFIRRRDGRVTRLDSTGIILGAVSADEFECGEVRDRLAPGETVLLYTDGATEARDTLGRMLGIERLEEAMRRQPAPRDWSAHVADIVDGHRAGPPEDDILIATLAFRGPPGDDRP
jgi:serine phosphatase RsbU (regulator of sigma subunit)